MRMLVRASLTVAFVVALDSMECCHSVPLVESSSVFFFDHDRVIVLRGDTMMSPRLGWHTLHFKQVQEDSRCPRDVLCDSSGPITIEIEIDDRTLTLSILERNVPKQSRDTENPCTRVGKYALRLVDELPETLLSSRRHLVDWDRAEFIIGPPCSPSVGCCNLLSTP